MTHGPSSNPIVYPTAEPPTATAPSPSGLRIVSSYADRQIVAGRTLQGSTWIRDEQDTDVTVIAGRRLTDVFANGSSRTTLFSRRAAVWTVIARRFGVSQRSVAAARTLTRPIAVQRPGGRLESRSRAIGLASQACRVSSPAAAHRQTITA
jgi:hypothetical protein